MIPGGPADKAGIQAGDIFEAIEGKSTREMSLAEIHNLLQGQPGSNVNVAVVRARRAEPQKTVITRDIVNVPPVADKMVEDGIGYIQVDAINKGKSQEVAAKIHSLQKAGAKRLILDLRNCAEGDESEGIAVANLFLNHGTITYLQGQKYPREAFNADATKAITNLPLAVLVNKGRRPGRGRGRSHYGKCPRRRCGRQDLRRRFGSENHPASRRLGADLSIAKYYSPSGKAIQDAAVTPNVVVADSDDDAALPDDDDSATPADVEKKQPPQQDEQLHKAIQVLKTKTT